MGEDQFISLSKSEEPLKILCRVIFGGGGKGGEEVQEGKFVCLRCELFLYCVFTDAY